MPDLITVCVFGVDKIELHSPYPAPGFETTKLDCRCYPTEENLYEVLAHDRPAVILSLGTAEHFPRLKASGEMVKNRWLHFNKNDNQKMIGEAVFYAFLEYLTRQKCKPKVSVFTPVYNVGDKLFRPFFSLQTQTLQDWEWIIVDDSTDNGRTWGILEKLAKRDFRIRIVKHSHSGIIGEVKRMACQLANGDSVLELDHDDELLPTALAAVNQAFIQHPEVGFVYSDFAECFENHERFQYPKGWGFGYGSYRTETWRGITYDVVNSPNINAKTIRHIVAAPNHLRAWRKSLYDSIGGHNPFVHVADDYEIMVRTFLATRMARIPQFLYIQYRNRDGNTSQIRNLEIQRLVRYFSCLYDKKIHERFVELGVDDFIWRNGELSFIKLMAIQNPEKESHATVII